MRVIEKKIWPKLFRAVKTRQKNVELRLADFRVAAGDTLLLRELDPRLHRYTGRSIRRLVRAVHRIDMTKFYSPALLKKFGIYALELS